MEDIQLGIIIFLAALGMGMALCQWLKTRKK